MSSKAPALDPARAQPQEASRSRSSESIDLFPKLRPSPDRALGIVTFGAAVYFLTALVIRPSVVLYTQQPVFLWWDRYFASFLNHPGGLLEYAAAFLMQFYAWDWLGAFVPATLSMGIALVMRGYLRALQGSSLSAPYHLLASGAVVCLLGLYDYPWVDTALGMVVSLGGAWVYASLGWKSSALRLLAFGILAVAIYILAAAQVLMFGVCAAISEAVKRRHFPLAALVIILSAVLPWLATFVYIIRTEDAYWLKLAWTPRRSIVYPALLVFLLPPFLGAVLAHVSPKLSPASSQPEDVNRKSKKRPKGKNKASGFGNLFRRSMSHPVLPILLATAALFSFWRPDNRRLHEIGLLSQQKRFSHVLQLARASQAFTAATVADVHRALANEGRLLDELFAYPQDKAYPLWLTLHDNFDSDRCMKASDMLFELGQVNKSERMAGEAMELNGYLPAVLERLALINVLKSETASARIFLNLLAKSPFERARAETYLSGLEADPRLADNEELRQVRTFQITEDYYGDHQVTDMMEQCLDRTPENRLALQYLLANHLLELNLEAVEQALPRLSRAGLQSIPLHCEEALLILQKLARGRILQLGSLSIRPETQARYHEFHRRFMSFGGNLELARAQMVAEFGDTYWFYYMFGTTGKALASTNRGVRP